MSNTLVRNSMTQENYLQYAPAQKPRTAFTPGKITSRPDDQNWPIDFKPAIQGVATTMQFDRTFLTARNTECDQTVGVNAVSGDKSIAYDRPMTAAEWAALNA